MAQKCEMSIRKLKSRGIGRLELLAWLNEFLETDYTKIEHLADGIAYCQIFDALYRGKVALHQVNFQAKSVMDYERNFNVLNRAFQACEIRKEIPIRKLVQGIFQEHFEFLHWVHDHVHRTYPDALHSYRGFARRQQVLGSAVSLTQLNSTNSNLVPKFSNSTRRSRESYIESPSPELGGTRNLLDHSTFSLDNLEESNAPETNEKCENSTGPIAVEEAETLPAMLMFVQ
ncbi:TPA: hypothetical protein N0F65_000549 [Lagenidium giganteum]|uniref:Calponin-homology (CH) domain-containing protein n=1 Tax=Lagenidium giganteum TaxID=4803 RepID=A0AAV2Z475_9STRA|nr:TPA: hypothetical protein N0F65_000549 [Lagenidium giganteum]